MRLHPRPHRSATPRRHRRAVAATLASMACLSAVAAATPAALADTATAGSPPVAPDAPWTRTVQWLVPQLTVAEKISLIEAQPDPDPHGQPIGVYLRGVPRLGVPDIRHVNALGIDVYADTTGLPNRLGVAAAFDRDASAELGVETGKEGVQAGINLVYGPQVDLDRFPSWSRNFSTNGEDAYLAGQLASSEINGIQSQGLMAQVKHVSFYTGQNQNTPVLVSSQAAHETYLAATQAAVQQGLVSSIMCSYATFQIVGEQNAPQSSCGNSTLLTTIVKGEYGLKGFVTGDYGAVHATSDLLAGTDNEFRTNFFDPSVLTPLVTPSSPTYNAAYAAALDDSDARMLYEYERFGMLDNAKIPAKYRSTVAQHGHVNVTDNTVDIDEQAGSAVALNLAEQSGVLLKNDNSALPLPTLSSVAVVGPTSTLLPSTPGGERASGFGDRNIISPLDAMKSTAGSANVVSAPGIDWYGTTVPAADFRTSDDPRGTRGLTLTGTDAAGNPIAPTTVSSLDGKQTNLARGGNYTYTGYVDVTAADNYQLLLQIPYGADSGDRTAYNKGITKPAVGLSTGSAGAVALSVDGVAQKLINPGGNILPNDVPGGQKAANGQYLGRSNTGVKLALTPGLHQVSINYTPSATVATSPQVRFAWAPDAINLRAAQSAAQSASETVIFVDDSSPGVAEGGGDNPSTTAAVKTISASQTNLIQIVAASAHAAGHKVAVVLNSGAAVAMPWLSSVDSVLEMWYPGQEGGTATAQLLYGAVNPSGKLPITFPKDNSSTPFSGRPDRTDGTQNPGEATTTIKANDGVDIGYRWYTDPTANTTGVQPLFPFGYGLSYTSFKYGAIQAKPNKDGTVDVTFKVTNTGTRAGATSPQVYVGASPKLAAPAYDTNGLVTAGFQQSALKLVQFDHITLAAGQSRTMTLHVGAQELSAWDTVNQRWVLGTGARTFSLGASSADLRSTATVKVTGAAGQ